MNIKKYAKNSENIIVRGSYQIRIARKWYGSVGRQYRFGLFRSSSTGMKKVNDAGTGPTPDEANASSLTFFGPVPD
jgi:hypothetical protein